MTGTLRGRTATERYLADGATEAQAAALAEFRPPLRNDAGFAWRITDGLAYVTQRGREFIVDPDGTIREAAHG